VTHCGHGVQDAFGATTPQGAVMNRRGGIPASFSGSSRGFDHGPFQQAGEWRLQINGMAGRSYRMKARLI